MCVWLEASQQGGTGAQEELQTWWGKGGGTVIFIKGVSVLCHFFYFVVFFALYV